jgi:hypothetical protein
MHKQFRITQHIRHQQKTTRIAARNGSSDRRTDTAWLKMTYFIKCPRIGK